MVKNDDLKELYGLDSPDDDALISRTGDMAADKKRMREQAKKDSIYSEGMAKIRRKLKRNYLSCEYFQKGNK